MAFNESLIENFGLRFQRVMLQIGIFFGRQFAAAEGAFQVAAILAGAIMGIGYAIAWTNWNTGAQVGVIVGFAILFIGLIGGLVLMVRGQLTFGVVSLGIGLILGLVLLFQGGVLVGETLITVGGLLGVMFLMLTMAQLGVIGAETAGAAVVVDQGSRPAPGPSLEFSEHLSGDQVLRILRTISAVYATLAFMGLYASVVPVYTSLKGFLVILLTLFFLMFAAFGFASTMVWLPRLQRLSMFLAVIVIVLYTIHFVALAYGSSLSGILFPFEWVYTDKALAAQLVPFIERHQLAPETIARLMNSIFWAMTLLWWLFWGFVVGFFGPKLFRATGIIETPAKSAATAEVRFAAKSGFGKLLLLLGVAFLGLLVLSLAINVVLSLATVVSAMYDNADPANVRDTRYENRNIAPRNTNSSVPDSSSEAQKISEPQLVQWRELKVIDLSVPQNDWVDTGIISNPGETYRFELLGWDGQLLVKTTGDTAVGLNPGQSYKITKQGGTLKIRVFSVKSYGDKDGELAVRVTKRVEG